jgi:hypothetical protein
MIIKLGGWAKHPLIAKICKRLERIEGIEKKTTPQRCFIKRGDETLATLGAEKGEAVVEFRPKEQDYVTAHGSSFVRPHPLKEMALKGWLQARPSNDSEADQVADWISAGL